MFIPNAYLISLIWSALEPGKDEQHLAVESYNLEAVVTADKTYIQPPTLWKEITDSYW